MVALDYRRSWHKPGDIIYVKAEAYLYPADDPVFNELDYVDETHESTLALIIGTDHVTSGWATQHPWFLVLINGCLHFVNEECIMSLDAAQNMVKTEKRRL